MNTRTDARRAYQRTALDRHSSTVISLLLAAIVLGALVFGAVALKAEVDAFVTEFEQQTGQSILAGGDQ